MVCHRLFVELLDFFLAKSSCVRRDAHVGNELLEQKMHPSRDVGRFDNGKPLVATG